MRDGSIILDEREVTVPSHDPDIKRAGVCVVSILKGEEKFLNEWLAYHRLIGIDHFFLYDDDPKLPLHDLLRPHRSYVTIIPWAKMDRTDLKLDNQLAAYQHALMNHILNFKWTSFIDGDEFIVLRKHQTISAFLNTFTNATSISLNWHVFGHNGYFEDPGRLITSSLTRRMKTPSIRVKSITLTDAILNVPSAHYCNLKGGLRVDANGRPFSERIYKDISAVAHINHYQCRSFKRWMNRVERGDVKFNKDNNPQDHQWRLDTDLCLRQFVTTVARDKNEFNDVFMLKFRFPIQQYISSLSENVELSTRDKNVAFGQINVIAELLARNINIVDSWGLLSGKAGIMIYFFHYARFSGNKKFERLAKVLFREMCNNFTLDVGNSLSDGLSGSGYAIEYLVKKGFIDIDTNELLEALDELLYHRLGLIKGSVASNVDDIISIGKYYLSRITNPVNDIRHPRESKNQKILNEINHILNVSHVFDLKLPYLIGFAVDSIPYLNDKADSLKHINLAIDKILNGAPPALECLDCLEQLYFFRTALSVIDKISDHELRKNLKKTYTTFRRRYLPTLLKESRAVENLFMWVTRSNIDLGLSVNDFKPVGMPELKDILVSGNRNLSELDVAPPSASDLCLSKGISGYGLFLLAVCGAQLDESLILQDS